MSGKRERGMVLSYRFDKGYGFAGRDNEPSLFFHATCLRDRDAENDLRCGVTVEFGIIISSRGLVATDVAIVRA